MPSCPVLATTVAPVTGLPKMPATKVAVWSCPSRMTLDWVSMLEVPHIGMLLSLSSCLPAPVPPRCCDCRQG